jgi:CheY-like chemotaxis protein
MSEEDIHILHVDKSRASRNLVAKNVEQIASYHGVGSLAEARQAVAEGGLNFFILDYELPDGNGLQFARELRDDDRHQHTPILLYSASTDNELAYRAMQIGVNESLTKPMHMMEMCQKIISLAALPEIKFVKRELLQLSCFMWLAGGKYHEYSPDLNRHIEGASRQEVEQRMQEMLEAELLAKDNPEEYPADVHTLTHVVQLRHPEDDAA